MLVNNEILIREYDADGNEAYEEDGLRLSYAEETDSGHAIIFAKIPDNSVIGILLSDLEDAIKTIKLQIEHIDIKLEED